MGPTNMKPWRTSEVSYLQRSMASLSPSEMQLDHLQHPAVPIHQQILGDQGPGSILHVLVDLLRRVRHLTSCPCMQEIKRAALGKRSFSSAKKSGTSSAT